MTNNQKRKYQSSIIKALVGSALGTTLAFSAWTALGTQTPVTPTNALAQSTSESNALTEFENAIIDITNRSKDAVVSIVNKQDVYEQATLLEHYYRQQELPSPSDELQVVGEGSGVIYKIEGDSAYIVTNNHVIEDAKKVEVIMADGTTVDGELVGADAATDLAVIRIESKYAKTTLTFADSNKLQVGSLAIAMGSPLGIEFSNSVTQGIVSGINRIEGVDIDQDGRDDWEVQLIQTDAAINPGNSGGALINKNGELIGINSSKFEEIGVEGMGFAIPSNDVQTIIAQLEKDGQVMRPVLGVKTMDVGVLSSRSRLDILKLPENVLTGVAVAEVVPESVAEKFGIQVYDVITKVDDTYIESVSDLLNVLYNHKIGDEVSVTVLREGKEVQVKAVLEASVNSDTN